MSQAVLDRPAADVPTPPPARTRNRRIGRRGKLASIPLLAVVAFLVLVPAGFVLLAAFSESVPRPGSISFDLTLRKVEAEAALENTAG